MLVAETLEELFELELPGKSAADIFSSDEFKDLSPEEMMMQSVNNDFEAGIQKALDDGASIINSPGYWEDFAELLDAKLESVTLSSYSREIDIELKNGVHIEIFHNWKYDGSPTKPVTTISNFTNVSELGRFAIWDDVEDYADDIRHVIKEHEVEDLYEMEGGKGEHIDRQDVSQDELEVGSEVEMEHTNDSDIASEIAMDHLAEFPDYYTKLVKANLVDEPEALELYNTLFKRK